MCEQFAWRLLVLTEQLRPALDALEGSEEDPDRLEQLYHLDHGITRMRRVARDLRVLSGRGGEDIAGHTTSLVDVIRMAASAIEHYRRVSVGTVAELAVVAYAADDIASLLAALMDNATRYSPTTVTVSAHLVADGSVMLRVEDAGLGIDPDWLAGLNRALDGPIPADGALNGRHTGFMVVHRITRRYGLRVQLARRQPPWQDAGPGASGIIAMVLIPASLLCEIPGQAPAAEVLADARFTPAPQPPAHLGPAPAARPAQGLSARGGNLLPRREPGSVRTHGRQAQPASGHEGRPDAAAEGFAFAADLQAFSAALAAGGRAGDGTDDNRPGEAEGRML